MGEAAPANYIAEFLGTYVLVFTIGCNVLSGQPVWGGVSIACSLMVMIYALAKSSGANFNPAVSLALGLNKSLGWNDVAIYMVVQVIGGIAAGLSYVGMFNKAFNLAPVAGHTWWQAAMAETIYTFMLCFVVLNVAAAQKRGPNQFFGIAIGFVIVAGAYGAGAISGGCFNPAVAIGIDVSSAHLGFGTCVYYTFFEFIGAIVATVLYWVVRPDEEYAPIQVGDLPKKLVSEFIGTYILVLTVGLNVLGASTAGAFSIAASLMCMIFALGDVSGAHFNPAVTTAIMCAGRGKCPPKDGALYMVAQVFGGIAASMTYASMKSGKTFALKPEASAWSDALAAELVFTFVLAFVVLSVATSADVLTEYFGFAIGMCVTVGGCAIGKVSGGSLNPAVSIAISSSHVMGGGSGWPCLVYSFVELIAGALAAGAYMVTQPSEFSKDEAVDAKP